MTAKTGMGMRRRLLLAQTLVLLAGGLTTGLVAAVVGPPLFRDHLHMAGVPANSDEQIHAEEIEAKHHRRHNDDNGGRTDLALRRPGDPLHLRLDFSEEPADTGRGPRRTSCRVVCLFYRLSCQCPGPQPL